MHPVTSLVHIDNVTPGRRTTGHWKVREDKVGVPAAGAQHPWVPEITGEVLGSHVWWEGARQPERNGNPEPAPNLTATG